ncbi:hypothetical protein LVB77_19380 [Lysobacter sp. 5GHs7-4]|uniref:hypothetical protein n=1 Tax=Lysobacter sp. 5GHs7-4 TaxID=2904253 RepID=UPI001E519CCC|nr:hypothetical protein [Lysobacter sp. 5GHs7-4]UHQ22783.1 hypothetical protein LVB77_19380 [Lysobacter sp. 5GHs7-4]
MHATQLTQNHLRAVATLLSDLRAARGRARELGRAIAMQHAVPFERHASHVAALPAKVAANFAYCLSLSEAIGHFATWLQSLDVEPDDRQWKVIDENATFMAEAARQAAESFAAFEIELKRHLPEEIAARRFADYAKSSGGA